MNFLQLIKNLLDNIPATTRSSSKELGRRINFPPWEKASLLFGWNGWIVTRLAETFVWASFPVWPPKLERLVLSCLRAFCPREAEMRPWDERDCIRVVIPGEFLVRNSPDTDPFKSRIMWEIRMGCVPRDWYPWRVATQFYLKKSLHAHHMKRCTQSRVGTKHNQIKSYTPDQWMMVWSLTCALLYADAPPPLSHLEDFWRCGCSWSSESGLSTAFRTAIISWLLSWQARSRGVRPLLSAFLILAPWETRNFAVWMWASATAECRAVDPLLSASLMSASKSRKSCRSSRLSSWAAVHKNLPISPAVNRAPLSHNIVAISKCLVISASIKGTRPSTSAKFSHTQWSGVQHLSCLCSQVVRRQLNSFINTCSIHACGLMIIKVALISYAFQFTGWCSSLQRRFRNLCTGFIPMVVV